MHKVRFSCDTETCYEFIKLDNIFTNEIAFWEKIESARLEERIYFDEIELNFCEWIEWLNGWMFDVNFGWIIFLSGNQQSDAIQCYNT